MSDSPSPEEVVDLGLLARRLVLEGMPVQAVIAAEAGVSQSTVSRAIQGRIKTSSAGAKKLWSYASARAELLKGKGAEQRKEMPRAPVRAPRQPRVPRRRTDDKVDLNRMDREELAKEAMAGLRDYLNDAFDPQLVIEQLAVLRRAQDPLR